MFKCADPDFGDNTTLENMDVLHEKQLFESVILQYSGKMVPAQ